jgi:methylglutaconyl-CoA hydratase
MDYKTIRVEVAADVLHVVLNRPAVHNAFNDELIGEAIDLFSTRIEQASVRAVVLSAEGPSFCAGADLNWMSRMVSYSREENVRDSSLLAKMFALIDECPLPVIGRIQGAAIGGGVGLVAVCDIAIAGRSCRFGLSEVKLGILPAVISPYVIGKIGASQARALFLTGERFDADCAMRIGLVHKLAEHDEELDRLVNEILDQIRSSGPEAVRECKKLIAVVSGSSLSDAIPYTIDAISRRRTSQEGQQGMRAFLAKDKAPWLKN